MIAFHPFHLELSLDVARALLAFASKDTTRPHLGVGIESGAVCATDGHAAVMFDHPGTAESARHAADHDRRVWSRAFVETAVKVARAEKRSFVCLQYAQTIDGAVFPPCNQVMPDDGISGNDHPIGFNPTFVGQLTLVAKAVGQRGVHLTSLRGSLDPLGFKATGTEGLSARAAVMPMRI